MRLEVFNASMDDFFPGVFAAAIGTELMPPRGEIGLLDWRLCGAIGGMARGKFIAGNAGENMLFYSRRRRSKVYFFGTGSRAKPDAEDVSILAANILRTVFKAGEETIVLLAQQIFGSGEDVERATAFLSCFPELVKFDPKKYETFHLAIAGGQEAKNYYESLRKGMNKKGNQGAAIDLAFTE